VGKIACTRVPRGQGASAILPTRKWRGMRLAHPTSYRFFL
jgi:hypothetical protein